MGYVAAAAALSLVAINEADRREGNTRRAQQAARETEAAVRANEARKSRRQQVKEARIRKAQLENTAAVTGQTESSVAVASGDALTANLATNIGEIGNVLARGSIKSVAEQNILDAQRVSMIERVATKGASISGMVAGGS